MLKHPGRLIGDSWFFVHEGMVHCYYLTCPVGTPRHQQWDIGHATSADLVNWTVRDTVLYKGPAGAWDDCLATGSVIRWQGRFWMAYCGGRTAQVGVAVSDDLTTWTKNPGNPVTDIDTRFYEVTGSGTRKIRHWRDPFLWTDGEWVYHVVCASKREGTPDERGALGLARTKNMTEWEILPPPKVDPVAQELECPQIVPANGKYYLIFSTITEFFSSKFLAKYSPDDLGWSTYSMTGPTPFGPFRMEGTGRILPPSYPVQPYACQLVTWNGKVYLLGTLVHPDGDTICDPIPVTFTDQGVRAKG
jgi:beta-fructofuranosidase